MLYRHGDLNFKSTTRKLKGKPVNHNGSFVLAEGETTGHRHVITAEPDMMFIYDLGNGTFLLDLKGTATITHEEHKTIVLQPQKYIVEHEKEYDWFALKTKKVID